MNILYVSHEDGLGGASKSLLGIIDVLSDENSIFVLVYKKQGEFLEELKKRKCTIIYCPYTWWIIEKKDNWLTWKIKKLLHKFLFIKDYLLALKLKSTILRLKIDMIHSKR